MIGNLDTAVLQQLWWFLCSVVGSLFLFMTFVQGGQTLLWQIAETDTERNMVINSLGRKWELTFTTLVLFGGALFAAFPKFYATSFGGAYWVWILILFTFIIQAVSYEYRRKPGNLLGAGTYEFFLFINGSLGILLIGTAVGTFFTGSNFVLNEYNFVHWTSPLRGLEAALNFFNVSLGVFLVFHARSLGSMYIVNNLDFTGMPEFEERVRSAAIVNLICGFPFLIYFLGMLVFMEGYAVDPETGRVFMEPGKYIHNLLAMRPVAGMLAGGLVLVIAGIVVTSIFRTRAGIWLAGPGTVLVGLGIFLTAGYNNTPFYPSRVDLQSSLTIFNASSSHYTLTAMTYVAMVIPVVLCYIAYVWYLMDRKRLGPDDVQADNAEIY